ncbi:capsid cement protein [Iodobacter sp.]|uniref:capsid cement protein n=1 Tax=Iodobacter sp. TaxID=1915058 RepID=UPI0025D1EB76|nr:capsid cement protein [Iodobacter sp.]
MSQQAIALLNLPVQAVGAIQEYRCVGFNGAQATAAGQKVYGIARRGAASGQWTDLTILGTSPAESGAAIAVGQPLTCDASGRVIVCTALSVAVGGLTVAAGATAVTSTAANGGILAGNAAVTGADLPQHLIGYALQASAGAGEFIEVLLR